jgi:glycosyltransferase involved in cell wall biosynthesis
MVHVRLPCVIGGVGALLTKFTTRPAFIYIAGDWEATLQDRSPQWLMRWWGRIITWAFRSLIRGKPCFVAGDALLRKFADRDGMVRSVITTALDSEHILNAAPPLQALDQRLSLLFVGAVGPAKGIDYLLRATATLIERGSDIHLRIIGQTADEGRTLFSQIARLRLNDCVDYAGYMGWDQLIQEYGKSNLFILPSINGREGVPKVILEAMARGLPVIATNVGGVATLVRDGENGLLIEPQSVEAIVQAVERVVEDSELRTRIISSGLEVARQNTLDRLIDEMVTSVYSHYHLVVDTTSHIGDK